ncbi:hypothetical protein A3J78_02450 [Candidatus Beckwithbacteria bacterium RBG_13_35_6]|uniref:Uncharacterized protein n=1 Tax=Candidatus Beckwithbacteria bacterium RBG_13_35_6 TaxID=1797456 RepID=A0A1F5DEF6_9BACT|nr:MAG: hypothetical protein A3J78_02450 [Candidatus Beckwithbacteria bacterium RBG_13_35_6]
MAKLTVINLSEALKVKPKKVIRFLRSELGSRVNKGDLVASKKNLIGKSKKILSSVDGILEKLEESTGKLIIKEFEAQKESLKTAFKTVKNQISGLMGFGKAQGMLYFLPYPLSLKLVKKDLKNKIIVCPKFTSKGVFYKAEAMGVIGFILEKIKPNWFEEVKKTSLNLGTKIPLLVMGKKFASLKGMDNKKILCDGDNKVIIISKDETDFKTT